MTARTVSNTSQAQSTGSAGFKGGEVENLFSKDLIEAIKNNPPSKTEASDSKAEQAKAEQ